MTKIYSTNAETYVKTFLFYSTIFFFSPRTIITHFTLLRVLANRSGLSCNLRDATCVLYFWSFGSSTAWPIGRSYSLMSVQKDYSNEMQQFSLSPTACFNSNASFETAYTSIYWAQVCVNIFFFFFFNSDNKKLYAQRYKFFQAIYFLAKTYNLFIFSSRETSSGHLNANTAGFEPCKEESSWKDRNSSNRGRDDDDNGETPRRCLAVPPPPEFSEATISPRRRREGHMLETVYVCIVYTGRP